MGWFKEKDAYTRTKTFEEHRNMDLTVKRVIYKFDCNGLTYSCSLLSYMSDIKWNLCIHLRYFMRELVPLGVVVKPPAFHILNLLRRQDLRSMHIYYDSDAHLVSSTSLGGLLVH
jgi:hypothetical protein